MFVGVPPVSVFRRATATDFDDNGLANTYCPEAFCRRGGRKRGERGIEGVHRGREGGRGESLRKWL